MDARILVIEDDEPIADVIRQVLSDEGYTVAHARSAQQARLRLTAPDSAPWGLIISDAALAADGSPRGWLDELRALTDAPIVILSGWPAWHFANYVERGFAALVQKPFDIDEIIAVVRQHMHASTDALARAAFGSDVLIMTTLPEDDYCTYERTAYALQSNVSALTRHILNGAAPLLAEIGARTEWHVAGQWPEGLSVHSTLKRHDTLLHPGVQYALSPDALRVHACAADAVAHAMDLLKRAGETYALAHAAVERSRLQRLN